MTFQKPYSFLSHPEALGAGGVEACEQLGVFVRALLEAEHADCLPPDPRGLVVRQLGFLGLQRALHREAGTSGLREVLRDRAGDGGAEAGLLERRGQLGFRLGSRRGRRLASFVLVVKNLLLDLDVSWEKKRGKKLPFHNQEKKNWNGMEFLS